MQRGIIPIYQPGLEEIFIKNISEGRLSFTAELNKGIEKAEVIFLALPTSPAEDGSADLRYILSVAESLGLLLNKYAVIVNKSTVPAGTAEKVASRISLNCKVQFDVVSNLKFLREGIAVKDFMEPERVVIGSSSKISGVYLPDFNKIFSDSSYTLPSDIPFDYDMGSLYIAWGEKETFDLPVGQIEKLEREGKQVFITWEPWITTFTSLNLENKEIFKAICQGRFDSFLKRQSDLLNRIERPVYIRWGHNANKIDCPWSAITEKKITYYKMAHSYLQKFFDKNANGKIKWVWPAPASSRIRICRKGGIVCKCMACYCFKPYRRLSSGKLPYGFYWMLSG